MPLLATGAHIIVVCQVDVKDQLALHGLKAALWTSTCQKEPVSKPRAIDTIGGSAALRHGHAVWVVLLQHLCKPSCVGGPHCRQGRYQSLRAALLTLLGAAPLCPARHKSQSCPCKVMTCSLSQNRIRLKQKMAHKDGKKSSHLEGLISHKDVPVQCEAELSTLEEVAVCLW